MSQVFNLNNKNKNKKINKIKNHINQFNQNKTQTQNNDITTSIC